MIMVHGVVPVLYLISPTSIQGQEYIVEDLLPIPNDITKH